jgi:hypothetical protein
MAIRSLNNTMDKLFADRKKEVDEAQDQMKAVWAKLAAVLTLAYQGLGNPAGVDRQIMGPGELSAAFDRKQKANHAYQKLEKRGRNFVDQLRELAIQAAQDPKQEDETREALARWLTHPNISEADRNNAIAQFDNAIGQLRSAEGANLQDLKGPETGFENPPSQLPTDLTGGPRVDPERVEIAKSLSSQDEQAQAQALLKRQMGNVGIIG